MNTLPNEILHNIFILVSLEQRLECTLVCRLWYNCLIERSLLYDVEINSYNRLSRFRFLIKDHSNLAFQVEILIVGMDYSMNKQELYSMLPNVRIIQSRMNRVLKRQKDNSVITFEPRKPVCKLEFLEDDDLCQLARQLLRLGLCSQLKQLRLNIFDIEDVKKDILAHLKNTPALKELTLDYSNIGIADLEIIHESLPALQTLDLREITVVPNILPGNIIPATSVTTLKIGMVTVKDDHIYHDWFKYLARKYTNLRHFDYRLATSWFFDNDIERFKIFREWVFPMYKNLGIPIPYLNIKELPLQFRPFATLDEFGLRVLGLRLYGYGKILIFEQLAESNQSKYVESLTIDYTRITTPSMLHDFSSLTAISITNSADANKTIDLSDYFNAFPATLTSFSGHFSHIEIKESSLKPCHIKDLSLWCHTIHPKLTETISRYFPKLNALLLRGQVTENISVHLPDNRFKSLSIQVVDSGDHGYSMTNSEWHQPRYYIRKGTLVKRTTADNVKDLIIISLKYTTAAVLQIGELSIGV